MSAKILVTGNLGQDLKTRTTPQGKTVCDLNIAATHTRRNQHTNQWEDVGDPLWLRASFWDDTATHLASTLQKGDRVTVEGTLTRREYTKQDGTTGESLELHFPRFLGVVPRRSQGAPGQANTGFGGPTYQQPASDPWAAPGGPQHTTEAPF